MLFVKCVIEGDHGIGKTCMLITYTTKSYPGALKSYFDNYSSNIMVEGTPVSLGLWDHYGGGMFIIKKILIFYTFIKIN